MEAIEILKDKLVGQFISRFSAGDTWDLSIDGYWLMAQEIFSKDETLFNMWLQNDYHLYDSTVDKEDISKSAIVASILRREITDLKLDELCNLTLEFEGGAELVLLTSAAIVDWQWCLNKTGSIPYSDYLVACFWEGEIAVNENQD
ncbi:hypothetical protein ACFQ48_01815 [Hymenobacter caeli]|uniref:Uncharacterized protein n=1 Tax=Hymenobacter caeli TaxID=2735894 RepID=A0ABX2FM09_9BACT|nr:hypothetical protein [Hymenobacter caeli]NRT17559.1 hypothetical protein [Hymenobacter caeli]